MGATYRDENEGLKLQIETLLERYREESKSLTEPLRLLYMRRSARMLAGKVAIFDAALLALVTVFTLIRARSFLLPWRHTMPIYDAGNGGLTLMLLALLVTVVIAYAVGLLLARSSLTAKLARALPLTGDAHRDLAQLEAASPLLDLRRLLVEQAQRSISLPLFGALLLLPITLHLSIYLLFGVPFRGLSIPLRPFDQWIVLNVVLATPAHLVVASMGSRLPRRLAEWCEAYEVGERLPPTGAGRALFLAAAVSLVPGVIVNMNVPGDSTSALRPVFLAISVVLLGAPAVIPAFHVARKRFLAERALLAA